jgi:putative peptidoglycan lipid II flippase
MVLARMLGTGGAADAFFVAFRIPNVLRDMFGEGAANSAVVPVLTEYKEKRTKEELWEFINLVFIWGAITLSCVTIIGEIFAPVLIRLMAPGFMADPEKLSLAIKLNRIIFSYLIFIGLTSYTMAALHTFKKFMPSAFSPCLFNIAVIITALLAGKYMKEPVKGLAFGVLIGGVIQLLFQQVFLRKLGMKLRWPHKLEHPGVAQIGRLIFPRMLGGVVYQLSIFIDTLCASLAGIVGAGGVSAVYYANRLIQFPMGLFSVALASAVLPSFAGMAANKDHAALKRTVILSMENIFFIMAWMTVVLMVLAEPIVRVLFQRGQFDAESTRMTVNALTFFAIGLFGFGAVKILVAAFHSLQDTKTPAKVAFFCLLLNASLNVILMFPMKIGGIALASSIAGSFNFFILYRRLENYLGPMREGIGPFSAKVAAAAAASGTAGWFVWEYAQAGPEFLKLVMSLVISGTVYWVLCLVMKVDQARHIKELIFKK